MAEQRRPMEKNSRPQHRPKLVALDPPDGLLDQVTAVPPQRPPGPTPAGALSPGDWIPRRWPGTPPDTWTRAPARWPRNRAPQSLRRTLRSEAGSLRRHHLVHRKLTNSQSLPHRHTCHDFLNYLKDTTCT